MCFGRKCEFLHVDIQWISPAPDTDNPKKVLGACAQLLDFLHTEHKDHLTPSVDIFPFSSLMGNVMDQSHHNNNNVDNKTQLNTPATPFKLSDLCYVCLEAKPIYKCPSCSNSTCSLACSRRHKTRTGCSGTRNAFTYHAKLDLKDITKPNLANDYKFLEGIERKVVVAEADSEQHGTKRRREDANAGSEGQQGKDAGIKPTNTNKVGLQQAFEAAGVRVITAPSGITRSAENETKYIKVSKRQPRAIHWTVEWIVNGKSVGRSQVREGTTLKNAYSEWQGEMNPELARTTEKKRKHQDKSTSDNTRNIDPLSATSDASVSRDRFFIRKLPSPANETILLPLDGSASLKTVLIGKTVLEFPSIYVFQENVTPEDMDMVIQAMDT